MTPVFTSFQVNLHANSKPYLQALRAIADWAEEVHQQRLIEEAASHPVGYVILAKPLRRGCSVTVKFTSHQAPLHKSGYPTKSLDSRIMTQQIDDGLGTPRPHLVTLLRTAECLSATTHSELRLLWKEAMKRQPSTVAFERVVSQTSVSMLAY